jgi:hypothetical protein
VKQEPKFSKENINKLIEFRQAVYEHGITARRDAVFDLLDALIAQGPVSSFARLSQAEPFRRKWPSLYTAVEDGQVDAVWLRQFLAQQVPQTGICVFALDSSPWPRPRAKTLDDRQLVFQASSDVNGGTIAIDYPYSSLDWVKEAYSSWALLVDERRVSSDQTAQEVGTAQIEDLSQARAAFQEVLDIVAADGKYGNAGFLRSVKGQRCGIAARLRCDRVLFGTSPPCEPKKRGRNQIHGKRFAFKEPDTWGNPDEVIDLEDPYWGQVRLERWNHLHEKKGADVPYDVIRASVHREREKPPAALWLAWLSPKTLPVEVTVTAQTAWRAHECR